MLYIHTILVFVQRLLNRIIIQWYDFLVNIHTMGNLYWSCKSDNINHICIHTLLKIWSTYKDLLHFLNATLIHNFGGEVDRKHSAENIQCIVMAN